MTALLVTLRIAALLTGTSIILTYTTSPTALTDGLERLLAPLARLHVPVHDFAMMMTIALRFIPTLIEETEKIMNAQRARGGQGSHPGADTAVPLGYTPRLRSCYGNGMPLLPRRRGQNEDADYPHRRGRCRVSADNGGFLRGGRAARTLLPHLYINGAVI